MKSTGYSSPWSRFAVYLAAGYSFGVMVRRVRFRELETVTEAIETTQQSVDGPKEPQSHHLHRVWSRRYSAPPSSPALLLTFPMLEELRAP